MDWLHYPDAVWVTGADDAGGVYLAFLCTKWPDYKPEYGLVIDEEANTQWASEY